MTLQQTPEKRPRKIDINLLPPEYRPAKKSRLSLILIVAMVVLACALVPVITLKFGVDSDVKPLRAEITQLDATIAARTANNREATGLQAQIDVLTNKSIGMYMDYAEFLASRIVWSDVVTEIFDCIPNNRITLNSITPVATSLEGMDITLIGTATGTSSSSKRLYIHDYVTALEKSDFFEKVDFSFSDITENTASFTITAPLDSTYLLNSKALLEFIDSLKSLANTYTNNVSVNTSIK
jgi:Tfp pilus assembly protein PilN